MNNTKKYKNVKIILVGVLVFIVVVMIAIYKYQENSVKGKVLDLVDHIVLQVHNKKVSDAVYLANYEKIFNIGRPAIKPLINILKTEKSSSDHKVIALASLVELSKRYGQEEKQRIGSALMLALKDREEKVRVFASQALGVLGETRAVNALGTAGNDEVTRQIGRMKSPDITVRAMAADEVTRQIGRMKSPDSTVRDMAAWKLGKLGDRRAVPTLIQASQDDEFAVRYSAVSALGEIGDPRAVAALINVLTGPDYPLSVEAQKALLKIGSPAVLQVIPVLNHEKTLVRTAVADLLGELGDKRAIEPLLAALDDRSIRASVTKALAKLADKRTEKSLRALLNDREYSVRIWAAVALVKLGEDEMLEQIKPLAKSKEVVDRRLAISALGETREPKVFETVRDALQDDDYFVRREAVIALSKIGNDQAMDAIVPLMKDHSQERYVRSAVIEALEALDWQPRTDTEEAHYLVANDKWIEVTKLGAAAIEPLVDTFRNRRDEHRRLRALETLKYVADERVAESLYPSLWDKDDRIRLASAEVLTHLKDKRGVSVLAELATKKEAMLALRLGAVHLLGDVGRIVRGEKAFVPLTTALIRDPEPLVRMSAAKSLGKLGDPVVLGLLVRSLETELVDGVKVQVMLALGKLGDRRAIDPLAKVLLSTKENEGIRLFAAHALGELKDERAVTPLVTTLLTDSSAKMRVSAAHALGFLGNKDANDALMQSLKDTEPTVQVATALALTMLGDQDLIDSILAALQHQDSAVRKEGIYALRTLRSEDGIPALITTMNNDKEYSVRVAAAEALAELADKRAFTDLLQALKDNNRQIRRAATTALGNLRDNRAVDRLINALKDEDSFVRMSAAKALGKIGDGRSCDALIDLLKNENEPRTVREAAAAAVRKLRK